MNPLCFTGLGIVSPIAMGRESWIRAVRDPEGSRAVAFGRAPTILDPSRVPGARAAEVWDFDPKDHLGTKGLRNFDRLTTFLIVAAKHALEDAGIKRNGEFIALDPERVGVCCSTAYGSLDAITELNLVAELEDPRYINPARFPNTVINAAAGYVSIWEDLRAPNVTLTDGNCGALNAVLACETHLAHGRADCFLVGGGEVLSEALYLAFRKLGLMREAETGGDGLYVGEGAALLCVERTPEAVKRGAPVLAEIVGYGTSFYPPLSEVELVHASERAVQSAIKAALRDAGLTPSDVDAVCCAAGGLALIDDAELRGIEAVFGPSIPVANPKRIFGETFGAAGAFGMATALAWLHGGEVAPLLRGESPADVRTVVVTAVGFYGNVSAVVLTRVRGNR